MKIISLHKKEEQLIALVKKQDRASQKKMFDQFAPKMLGVCRQYVKNIHDAEDVMLCGFMKVFQNIHQFEHKGSFEGWIRKIMVFESISFLRSRKEMLFTEEVSYKETLTEDHLSFYETEALQHMIDTLPAGCKTVFILYVIEGYKHQEIAEMLMISEGTSKSQLANARKLLQNQLKKKEFYNGAF
ncbi:RNA polymerase sigma factor [Myroides ceti]|uniref:RNA polymerase sigma factor n=1 Tax=Paenimyroides ceti TaxID=395087 RepID=A0ABT8CV75_9FLAO|nr:RNA polymerase sigma factor [Paenimyroides ceti]MDN3708408.1 RNA polymerase sigma factor [Paenimyroides ceti]